LGGAGEKEEVRRMSLRSIDLNWLSRLEEEARRMSLRSIDLNWLSRLDKHLLLPDLEFCSLKGMGQAAYFRPKTTLIRWNRETRIHNGKIIVDPSESTSVEASMAHEWRHHWQFFQGRLGKSQIPDDWQENYWMKIKEYFTIHPWELDALRFELKMFPVDLSRLWMEAVQRGG
jgi:hypothetical protein